MKGSLDNPKVFISYSWSTPKHEQWVLELAERLFGDGVLVTLDKWDLKEGQDKHSFMEQMVSDPAIQKVLVICDAEYQKKANDRKGGVGTESQLISKEVYENTAQEKFIPIVCEYDGKGKPCIPVFMASRIYIDLSNEATFIDNYQRLVRNLYNRPELKKPVLGTAPGYITEDEPSLLRTSHKVQEIKNAIISGKPIARALISDYYDLFLQSLEDFRISGGNLQEFDNKVVKSIEDMKSLRDDFIDFLETIFKYHEKVDLEELKEFLEKLFNFHFPSESVSSYTEIDCDNYKFFCYELILYLVQILFKLRKYEEAAYFIQSHYYYRYRHRQELTSGGIEIFNPHIIALDEYRNKRLNLRRVSVVADLIKDRADRKGISFDNLMNMDLILYYLRSLLTIRPWFPRTSAYNSWDGNAIDFFQRQISKQFFDKVKVLYDVGSKDELKAKIEKYSEEVQAGKRRNFDSWNFHIGLLEKIIDIDQIATQK